MRSNDGAAEREVPAVAGLLRRVSEGTRTPDRLDHNQELYQLSYAHRVGLNLAAGRLAQASLRSSEHELRPR
jgi:hypothetical protein